MLCWRPDALFVMLNPSTADADLDDPTIRRCRRFVRLWGCRGLVVANLYALRSTDPAMLWKVDDPVGPDNDSILFNLARQYGEVICAWGANAQSERVDRVVGMFREAGAKLLCLGTTRRGAPRHPLYVSSSTQLTEWSPDL
ncbi:hypothetical protein SAMN06265784_101339 [Paraburkholderia susongensis]|uniref:DUF1643 domain-containing protein n=2 Tax=Paraburkholderia susongensis TaxID=1515439 RepID=A0A1X7I611_9BURK|nr:hypothetical protein SAMN06265784_101339 [Paraburkholderia susongensis]